MEELRKTGYQHYIEASFIQVGTHKDIIKYHCIHNGMWYVLNIQYPKYHTKKADIFSHISIFQLRKIQYYVEELRKTGYQHQIEDLYCSGLYMHESLHVTIIENNIKIISVTSSGPEALTCVFELISMVSLDHI